ncbi:hypothetical protein HRM2_42830 [Desulforapulum autotrophicum HRM2]|uniref:Uncharacterized protein n=2 Tax=Desulforapulum autotrophicum TaxID=2296 RepID=C0QDR8_DESAH|nr:hypothetical protein HRM2_42830 [Desulforapulum autotrophicum HRM2]
MFGLDMGDGVADGTPELHHLDQYRIWATVFSQAFFELRSLSEKGKKLSVCKVQKILKSERTAVREDGRCGDAFGSIISPLQKTAIKEKSGRVQHAKSSVSIFV